MPPPLFYNPVQGDALYAQFWDRVQNEREETVFSSIKDGLDLLLGESNFFSNLEKLKMNFLKL